MSPLAAPAMCPDSLPRLWRYINLLLTYLLTYLILKLVKCIMSTDAFCQHQAPDSAYQQTVDKKLTVTATDNLMKTVIYTWKLQLHHNTGTTRTYKHKCICDIQPDATSKTKPVCYLFLVQFWSQSILMTWSTISPATRSSMCHALENANSKYLMTYPCILLYQCPDTLAEPSLPQRWHSSATPTLQTGRCLKLPGPSRCLTVAVTNRMTDKACYTWDTGHQQNNTQYSKMTQLFTLF